MAKFSAKSQQRLDTCDFRLRRIFREVIQHVDCTILCGHRDRDEQEKVYREGRSKVSWPNSRHNKFPSLAVDVVPYPIRWSDKERFILFAGFAKGIAASMGYELRWGGDWDGDYDINEHSFLDMPHFELPE